MSDSESSTSDTCSALSASPTHEHLDTLCNDDSNGSEEVTARPPVHHEPTRRSMSNMDENLTVILEALREELPPHICAPIENVIVKVLTKRIHISKLDFQRFLAVLLKDNGDALRRAVAKGKRKLASRAQQADTTNPPSCPSPQTLPPSEGPPADAEFHSPTRQALATGVEEMAL